MDAVKAFNSELSSLFDARPPISKAKMTAITRTAIKAIKFYKHVVQSVEKFIQKCKPEYKVPGLYVVDSIVRQSRHQFSPEKDVFAPRFARNIQTTFAHLFNCPSDDKGKIVRVLNLWQKNQVFTPDVIQPLLDMASRVGTDQPLQPTNGVQLKTPPTAQNLPRTPSSKPSPVKDPAWLTGNLDTSNVSSQLAITPVPQVKPPTNSGAIDPNIMLQLQNLQSLLLEKQSDAAQYKKEEVKFDKKLLDFDYDEDDEEPSVPQPSSQPQQPLPSIDSLQTILSNPEVLRHLQTLQQQMSNRKQEPTQEEIEEKMRRLQEMRHQEEEFDKHLAQTLPNLPFAAECDFKPSVMENTADALMSQAPPPVAPPQQLSSSMPAYSTPSTAHPFHGALHDKDLPTLDYDERSLQPPARVDVEVIDLLRNDSPPRRSPPRSNRDSRRRRRSRSRNRHSRSRSRSRRRARSTSEDRETERRRKRGLPPIKKNHLAVCSTTLWIGHLSKLVTEEELSNTFGNYGEIVSINLIPPRGCGFVCMNRRQDADKALRNLKHVKLHSKAITIAWAPGKAMKEKEWKDYWEVETGTSYIPWNKLSHDTDYTLLEEGGMLDEETFPDWLKTDAALRRRGERKDRSDDYKNLQDPNSDMQSKKDDHKKADAELDIPMPAGNLPGFIPLPETTMAPPPVSQPATPMPPPPLGLLPPPFALPPQRLPGLLGPMGPPMMGPMGNVPLGVPPPLMMPPPPQQMVPRMPGPFNPGHPVGMMPMPPGDKSKPPQMPGMPPDGFTDHIASMFGLPVSALAGMNLQQTLAQSQQQQMTKGAAEMEVDDPEEKDIQSSNLEIISALGTNMVGNFSQPPPNFSLHPNQNQTPQTSNQNNSAFKGRGEGRSDSRSDDKKSDKEDTPRKNRERDGKDRHDDRDRDKRRRRDSPDRGRDRDRERRRGGSDRGRRDWGGKGIRSSKWGDRDKDEDRKDWKGNNNTPGGSNKENSERGSDDEMLDMKTLPLPPSSQQHEPGSPAIQFPPGIRPPGQQGPGGFGPRFGPPKNDDGHQINMGMQGPLLGIGAEFMSRDFQPPIRGDFPPRDFQAPMRGDFPPTRGDFQGPSRDFQGSRDFPGPPRDFPGPPRDFQGPPRDFQPRGDFQSPRGDFQPRYFGPRGPMRPPMGPQQGGPRHRQPNGPMFGPQRGPPGPIGMRGPRGIPPVRMDGPPHGFMARGFPPRMRGGPPHRFGGPPVFSGNKGNMGGDGPPVSRRWGEDDRPPRRSRWSSAPDSGQQSETDSEVPHSEQVDNQHDVEDKNSEPVLPPGAEEATEFPPNDLGSSDLPNESNVDFDPKESGTEFTEEAEFSEVNNVTDHADGSQSGFMENDNVQSCASDGQPQIFGESHRKSRWSCASNDLAQPDSLPETDVSLPTNQSPLYSEVDKDSEAMRPPGEEDFVPVDFGPSESQHDFSSEFAPGETASELVESTEVRKIETVISDNANVHETGTEHIKTTLASDSAESPQKE